MTPAEAWADAQKYMPADELARLSKSINAQGQYNPGMAGGAAEGKMPTAEELVSTFNQLPEDRRGDFINAWDQSLGRTQNGSGMLQQALRQSMGKENFDNWYATNVQNKQGSSIKSMDGLPSWMSIDGKAGTGGTYGVGVGPAAGGGGPPGGGNPMAKSTPAMTNPAGGPAGAPGGAGGWSPFAMMSRNYKNQGGVGGSYYGGYPFAKSAMVDPTGGLDPTGGGGGGGGGGLPTGGGMGQLLQRIMDRMGGGMGPGGSRGGGPVTPPVPYGRGNPPPAGGAPPPAGGGAPPPAGGGAPPPAGYGPGNPNPATWNGLPMRGFNPSWLISQMRQHYGSGGGAGAPWSAGGFGTNNSQAQWNRIYDQPMNRGTAPPPQF